MSNLSKPGYNLFCSGHSFLADGTLFVAGGHIATFVGLSRASIYNPFTNAWSNLPKMNAGRWYPTTTVLANGDVLVVSGTIDPSMSGTGAWSDVATPVVGGTRSYGSAVMYAPGKVLVMEQGPLFDQISRSDRRHCQKFHYLAS